MIIAIVGALAVAHPSPAQPTLWPEVIDFDSELAALIEPLDLACERLTIRSVDPDFLPDGARKHQLDCEGLNYFGQPRWTEFVLNDGELAMVWLMVDDSEKHAFLARLRSAYGEPDAVNDTYFAYYNYHIAWRNEPAELLFWSSKYDEQVVQWFEPNSEQAISRSKLAPAATQSK